ncbi:MAG: hypothetical protein VKO21_02610 [Candidatus Sericytochromatia bacterium]|nr:hypothetical protein [Candidatus Sericytochromatia bacterium]
MTPADWLPLIRVLGLALMFSGLVRSWRGAPPPPGGVPWRLAGTAALVSLAPIALVPVGPKFWMALGGWGAGSVATTLALVIGTATPGGGRLATSMLGLLPLAMLTPFAHHPSLETGYAWAAAVLPAAAAAWLDPAGRTVPLALNLAAATGAAHVLGRVVPEGLGWAWVMVSIALAAWLGELLADRGKMLTWPAAHAALTVPAAAWLLELPAAAWWAPPVALLAAGVWTRTVSSASPAAGVARLVVAGGTLLLVLRLGGILGLGFAAAAWAVAAAEATAVLVGAALWTRLALQDHLDRSWLGREGVDLTHPYAMAGMVAGLAVLAWPAEDLSGELPDRGAVPRLLSFWALGLAVGGVLGLEAAGAALMGLIMMSLLKAAQGKGGAGTTLGWTAASSLLAPAMVWLGGQERPIRLLVAGAVVGLAGWSWGAWSGRAEDRAA